MTHPSGQDWKAKDRRELHLRIEAWDRSTPAMREAAEKMMAKRVGVPEWVARWWFAIKHRVRAGSIGGPNDGA